MPQKIKIIRLTKPYEYIKKELDIIKGQKIKLLSSSDWTQVIDNGLTTKSVLEWRFWRNKVRSVDTSDHSKILLVQENIDKLEQTKPQTKKRTDENSTYILSDFNYSTIESFGKSCIMILSERKTVGATLSKRIKKAKTYDEVFAHFIKEF